MDKEDGVWRTIGGRRVFIKKGQSLADAMKESGKFKSRQVSKGVREDEYVGQDDKVHKMMTYEYPEDRDEYHKYLKNKYGTYKEEEIKDENGRTDYKKLRQDFYDYQDKREKELADYKRGMAEYWERKAQNSPKDADWTRQHAQETADRLRADIGETKGKDIKDTRNMIKSVAENSKEDNITLDTETGEAVKFDKGYSVSFQQSTDNYSDKEFDEKVNECKNICNGKLYAGKYGGDAEPSFYTEDLSSAKEIMYKYNQESIYDWETDDYIYNEKYDASKNKTNFNAEERETEKTTNETMNEKIRARGKKEVRDDLPQKTEIKEQGTSNRKEVSENIQAHILEFYDNPQDFIDQMENMNEPTMWRAGEKLAQGGSYEIYYDDQREFLNSLKINPKGKEFSDDRVFQTYNSLIGRESAKLYDRLKKNAFNKYKREHPLSKMSFEEFKNNRD